jgi:putative flippase GtrA
MLKNKREALMYLVFGTLTVAVNIVTYRLFLILLSDIPANTIAFFIALVFAYFANCLIVFRQRLGGKSAFQFIGMRIGTLLVDNGGIWLLLSLNCNWLTAKIIINIVIVVLNYAFSKFIIFHKKS